jgi:hypothetical protein
MKHHFFLSNVENILKELPLNYSSIIIRDLNIYWLVKTFQTHVTRIYVQAQF